MANETNWYSVKVRPNYEKIVAERIKLEMKRLNRDINVVVPAERVFVVKNGKKQPKERILYAGYIFVETLQLGELMAIIRETTGANGVLKAADGTPHRLRDYEVEKMLNDEIEIKKPVSEEYYVKGETVNIIHGPFAELPGVIDELDYDTKKVKVLVSIFKKMTPVDLSFDDIKKI